METPVLVFDVRRRMAAAIVLGLCLAVLVAAELVASLVQRDFGRVAVGNVTYPNANGIEVRAKLLRPVEATESSPAPGIVYVHGYQNNRETSDAYAIELARRGFVVLSIDAIGRGNSGVPGDPDEADFDETYGTTTSLAYLRALPYVRDGAVGLMGHSLGAEMAYAVARQDPAVRALAFSGFAYRADVPAATIPQTGAVNSFSVQNTGGNPGLFTQTGAPIQTITPAAFTVEASFKPESGGYRTIDELR